MRKTLETGTMDLVSAETILRRERTLPKRRRMRKARRMRTVPADWLVATTEKRERATMKTSRSDQKLRNATNQLARAFMTSSAVKAMVKNRLSWPMRVTMK